MEKLNSLRCLEEICFLNYSTRKSGRFGSQKFLRQRIRSHTEGGKEMALPINSDKESREWQEIEKKDSWVLSIQA